MRQSLSDFEKRLAVETRKTAAGFKEEAGSRVAFTGLIRKGDQLLRRRRAGGWAGDRVLEPRRGALRGGGKASEHGSSKIPRAPPPSRHILLGFLLQGPAA